MHGQQLIKTDGCYVGIFDALSPVNAAGRLSSVMQAAVQEAAAAGQPWASILHVNDHWSAAMQRGDILAWVVLFDGVFKATATVLVPTAPHAPTPEQSSRLLGGTYHPLSCPSGRIIVASLSDLGSQTCEPIIVAQPGTYHVALTVDDRQEGAHAFLDDGAQYPDLDGPDWAITLWSA